MKLLKLLSTLLALLVSSTSAANPLYSWTTKDGTPTYSPDPPPKGVSYEIVGADLQPLAGKPVTPTTAQPQPQSLQNTAITGNAAGNLVLTPSPGSTAKPATTKTAAKSPSSKWKPVIYADDPNPTTNKPKVNAAGAAPVTDPTQSIQPVNQVSPVNQLSEACLSVRKQIILLEGQFANALTARQMDDAIVRLNVFRNQNKGHCGL